MIKLDISGNFRILSEQEEKSLEKNLFWIFGSSRSGTSWLRQLLSFNTLTLNEPLIGQHINTFTRGDGILTTSLEFHQRRNDYFFHNEYSNVWAYFLRKMILNRIFAQFQDLSKKIIIKEPNGSLGAYILMKSLPNSKMIFIIRDGRDVMDSVLDANLEGGWLAKRKGHFVSTSERKSFLKENSKRWVKRIEILLKTFDEHPDNLRYLIRYEDLKSNTIKELEKIYKFLQVDMNEKQLQRVVEKYSFSNIPSDQKGKGKGKRSATPGLWSKNFSTEEKDILNQILHPTLQKLGY